ncbi:hypothetical protein GCM10009795_038150 [Nocardioides hankookensis]
MQQSAESRSGQVGEWVHIVGLQGNVVYVSIGTWSVKPERLCPPALQHAPARRHPQAVLHKRRVAGYG